MITGVCAGVATVFLLRTINEVLNQQGGMAGGLLFTFIGLCLVALFGRMASDVSTNFVGQRLVAQVRKSLAQKINPPAGAGGAGWLAVAFMANPLWLRGA